MMLRERRARSYGDVRTFLFRLICCFLVLLDVYLPHDLFFTVFQSGIPG
jgi:hypothetical protein